MIDLPVPIIGSIEALARMRDTIVPISDECYTTPLTNHAAIGEHVRHCLDHVECFLAGYASGQVDYDARARNSALENDREMALEKIREFMKALECVDGATLNSGLAVRHTCAHGAEPVVTDSTIGRELAFLSSHTLHHIALVALIAEAHGAATDPDLTLAFSTESYRRENG